MTREWQGCQLVNSLVPEDLCVLPENHDGFHHLRSMDEHAMKLSPALYMAPDRPGGKRWPEEYLVMLGEWLANFCIQSFEADWDEA